MAAQNYPNAIKLATCQNEGQEKRVVFGGGAIVRIAGEYQLTEQNTGETSSD